MTESCQQLVDKILKTEDSPMEERVKLANMIRDRVLKDHKGHTILAQPGVPVGGGVPVRYYCLECGVSMRIHLEELELLKHPCKACGAKPGDPCDPNVRDLEGHPSHVDRFRRRHFGPSKEPHGG